MWKIVHLLKKMAQNWNTSCENLLHEQELQHIFECVLRCVLSQAKQLQQGEIGENPGPRDVLCLLQPFSLHKKTPVKLEVLLQCCPLPVTERNTLDFTKGKNTYIMFSEIPLPNCVFVLA